MVQENQKTMSFEKAIKKAVLDCINQNILKEFLEKRKQEVVSMLLEEWKLEDAVAVAREDRAIEIAKKMRAIGISVDDIAKATGLTVDDVLRL
jgi:predicted transposase/invertase (TIGR01784 family)